MIVKDCKCVSAPKSAFISKRNNNRQYSITYWRVVDDNYPSGVYFRNFQWLDSAKTVYREGVIAKCALVNGEYQILEI